MMKTFFNTLHYSSLIQTLGDTGIPTLKVISWWQTLTVYEITCFKSNQKVQDSKNFITVLVYQHILLRSNFQNKIDKDSL